MFKKLLLRNLALIILFIVAAMNIYRTALTLPTRIYTWDFNHYYLTAKLLLNSMDPYVIPMSTINNGGRFITGAEIPTASNPPLLTYILAPFASLPVEAAFWAWVGIQVFSLTIIITLCFILLRKEMTFQKLFLLVTLCLASKSVYSHFYFSQVQLLIAALILFSLYLLQKGHGRVSCMVVTFAGLLKIYPFVFLPWFIWKNTSDIREIKIRAALAVLTAIALVCLTNPILWMNFFESTPNLFRFFSENSSGNYSLPSFVSTLNRLNNDFSLFELPTMVGNAIYYASAVGVPAFALLYCLRNPYNIKIEFSLITTAMLIGNILTWSHYFVFMIFPVSALALLAIRHLNSTVRIILLVCVVLMDSTELILQTVDYIQNSIVVLKYIPLLSLISLLTAFCYVLPKDYIREASG